MEYYQIREKEKKIIYENAINIFSNLKIKNENNSYTLKEEFKELKNKIELLSKEVEELDKKFNKIKRNTILLPPISLSKEDKYEIKKYKKFLKWAETLKKKYNNQYIAYIEYKHNKWKIIASSGNKEELYQNIEQKVIENKDLNGRSIDIYFIGDSTGYFEY
ncbi:MAG: hypothetical protein ACTSRP_23075 [Candidatus Helarchaeota archaeon]